MFPNTHPDLARQLAEERIGRLRADAEAYRRALPFLTRRRSARSVTPTATPSRVVPTPAPRVATAAQTSETAGTDRAA